MPSIFSSCHSDSPAKLPLLAPSFHPAVGTVMFVALLLIAMPGSAHAGGPHYIAGVSYFDPGTKGVPLLWAQGTVNYYTDPGDLSSLLPQASADAFVADAFLRWSAIPTVALAANRSGQLAEDVSGANVILNPDGTITMPADISPNATDKPVGIVYDADGAVTDALLGAGAGSPDYCFTNAVFGGPDNLGVDAHLLHALVVLNGNCAQTSTQLGDVFYRLVRVFGRVLGLDWSQVNLNVITRFPVPVPEDYDGFSIMHALDPISCVPIAVCYPNADQPKMDDRASLSRLYPVTAQNQQNFPGKQIFSENTIRIHGSVRFVDSSGQPAQPMQGVNVVARWLDPTTGLPSRTYAAASVSGFPFRGYAGNPVNGFTDGNGQRFDMFGSDDTAVEGFFDLAGLEIPDGTTSTRYQLAVEALDPVWSLAMEPYDPSQVLPSGTAQPITVKVDLGGDVEQDILMQVSASPAPDMFGPQDYTTPAPVPLAGDWMGTLSGYGDTDYFRFTGQANRTLSVEVTALDETGSPSQDKSLPVIGMWALADPLGTLPPAATPTAFNTSTFGMSRLDVVLLQPTDFRIGIADYRGDGRPDFAYHARMFYADSLLPARASVGGGTPVTIRGIGFRPGTAISIGSLNVAALAEAPNQLIIGVPAMADGVQSVALSDPVTGSASSMTDVLTFGAGPTDLIRLIAGSNPLTPVGGEAANPVRLSVVAADGVTPVEGASVALSALPSVGFAVCGGLTSCTVLSDASGEVSTRITALVAGSSTITAALAPASYSPPKIVQTTLLASSSALDLSMASPFVFILQGATLDVPISTRVLSNGVGLKARTVNFDLVRGSGTLGASNVVSDKNGYANTALHVSALAGDVQVTACVEPGDNPCQTFHGTATPSSQLRLEAVSGSAQVVILGQDFQPITVRVTDLATPPDPVLGAGVVFESLIGRPDQDGTSVPTGGDGVITQDPMPVILASSQSTVLSDVDGIASLQPSADGITGSIEIQGTISMGMGFLMFDLESLPAVDGGTPKPDGIEPDWGRMDDFAGGGGAR